MAGVAGGILVQKDHFMCTIRGCTCDMLAFFLLKQERYPKKIYGGPTMDKDTQRRLVYGLLSVILGAIATRLALYLTNRIVGEPEEDALV